MIVLRTPKGWTGPKEIDGHKVEGSWRAHQVPIADVRGNPGNLRLLEQWLPRLSRQGITYINFDGAAHCLELYDAVLKIDADGAWNWQQRQPDGWVRRVHGPAT